MDIINGVVPEVAALIHDAAHVVSEANISLPNILLAELVNGPARKHYTQRPR